MTLSKNKKHQYSREWHRKEGKSFKFLEWYLFPPCILNKELLVFCLAQGFAVCVAASAASVGVRILLGIQAALGNSLYQLGVTVSHLENGGNISQLLRIKIRHRAAKPWGLLRSYCAKHLTVWSPLFLTTMPSVGDTAHTLDSSDILAPAAIHAISWSCNQLWPENSFCPSLSFGFNALPSLS